MADQYLHDVIANALAASLPLADDDDALIVQGGALKSLQPLLRGSQSDLKLANRNTASAAANGVMAGLNDYATPVTTGRAHDEPCWMDFCRG